MLPRIFHIAVAGAGVIGRRHIELIQANRHTRLCAVADPGPASTGLAASAGVPHFASLEDLFTQQTSPKPDGVILATPNHLHVSGRQRENCGARGLGVIPYAAVCQRPPNFQSMSAT